METPLTLNNAHVVRELLIFLFSRNFILEVLYKHFRLLYRQNNSECSVECCTIRKVSANIKLLYKVNQKKIIPTYRQVFAKRVT